MCRSTYSSNNFSVPGLNVDALDRGIGFVNVLTRFVVASNAAKLIAKMQPNPRDWRIDDLKVVADRLGIDHDQHGDESRRLSARQGWVPLRASASAHQAGVPAFVCRLSRQNRPAK